MPRADDDGIPAVCREFANGRGQTDEAEGLDGGPTIGMIQWVGHSDKSEAELLNF